MSGLSDSFGAAIVGVGMAFAAWAGTDPGMMAIAGAAGGLARWIGDHPRLLRAMPMSVIGGMVAGSYLWPAVLAVFSLIFGNLADSDANTRMAAFLAGMIGIGVAKVFAKVIEARLTKEANPDA